MRVTQTVVSGVTVLVSFSVMAVWWMLATRWMRVSVSGGQPEHPRVTSATTLALSEAHWFHCAPGPRSVCVSTSRVCASAVAKPAVPALTFVVLAVSVLVVQVAAIRPRLSERSDRILAGEVLPRSRTHVVYIAFELVKVVLLISAIISLFQVLTACLH